MKAQGGDFTISLTAADSSLFGKTLMLLGGAEHAFLRKTLISVFSRKRLTSYLPTMESNIRKHLRLWIRECERNNGSGTIRVQSRARDMVFDFLMNAFLGSDYDHHIRWRENYYALIKGIQAFPLNFPGTTFWRALKARKVLIRDMTPIVQASIERAREGRKLYSFTDYWIQSLIEKSEGQLEDSDIKRIVIDHQVSFLLGGLDTTVSTLTAFFGLMSAHPDVLARMHSEQIQLRPNDSPITTEILNQMTYTTQVSDAVICKVGLCYKYSIFLLKVMREILRFENPLFCLGLKAKRDCKINGIFISKDTWVVPNLRHVLFDDGFSEPHKFDPDRFGPERREHIRNVKHYIPFGVGAHRCVGKNIAELSVLLTSAIASGMADWRRIETDKSYKMIFDATIVPADGCVISIKKK